MTAVLCGLGGSTPPLRVSNARLAAELDTDDDWIRTRTGIRQRYVVDGQTTGDLAVEAGRRALISAGGSVDTVVLATATADRRCPATAPTVSSRLGLTGAAAFDVAAVCAGFVYALAVAAGLISTGVGRRALVIGADTFSTILDPTDRATRAVFGDGAGAVVLRAGVPGEPGSLVGTRLGSDGNGNHLIATDDAGRLRMAGRPVFAAAVHQLAASIRLTVTDAGWSLAEVDRFVLHQANLRILVAVARQLAVDAERFVTDIDRVGNTVAASIPLALTDGQLDGGLLPGHRVVLAGFGGGLSWGSTALVWPELAVVPHRPPSKEAS